VTANHSAHFHEDARAGIDTSVPHSARIWNYWLGGKDNFAVDRAAGDAYVETYPGIIDIARAGRAFLTRAVRYLALEAGLRQFLDVGTGLPTMENTHEVAQRAAPASRVVYVDNDPLVLAHARAMLTSSPEGVTDYVLADMRDPETILASAAASLDLAKPTALLLMGVLGHIGDDDEAQSIVRRLMAGLAPGSFLALYDSIDTNPALVQAQRDYDNTGAVLYKLRSADQIARYFDGLELTEPGLVRSTQWRPKTGQADRGLDLPTLAGVARKP
jgi:S-adenosyl methyltransferase